MLRFFNVQFSDVVCMGLKGSMELINFQKEILTHEEKSYGFNILWFSAAFIVLYKRNTILEPID